MASALRYFNGTFGEAKAQAETTWQNMMYRLLSVSRQYRFTPMEMQLALAEAQVEFAYSLMDYAMYRESSLTKQETMTT